MKKIATNLIIYIFILLNIADTITTIIGYKNSKVFNEANPIFLLTNNLWISLLIMKGISILLIFAYFNFLKSKSQFKRYATVTIFILINLILFMAVQTNIKSITNEELQESTAIYIKEQADKREITENELKMEIYKQNISYPFYKSLFFIFAIYVIFMRVEKENTKTSGS